jgi:hypothetical protein
VVLLPGVARAARAGARRPWRRERALGTLVGGLDWDLASPFDPAVDGETFARAGVWCRTFA